MGARRAVLASLAVVASAALAGCSSSGGDSGSSPTAGASASQSVAPEDVIAPDAAVATGLKQLKVLAAQIATAAASDAEQAKTLSAGLEDLWKPIEGTVKKNAGDVYLSIEDAFAQLESGDAGKSAEGTTSLSAAVDTYLAAHPA